MLKSFEIRNFRLFQHLEVERLSRVNLIVGRNNSGKSTFLEAVQLYASNASPTVLLDLVESRQETWYSEAQPYSQNFSDSPIRHLYFGHKLPKIGEEGISLGEKFASTKILINAVVYQVIQDDNEETKKIVRISGISDIESNEYLSDIEYFLAAEEDGKFRRLFRLDKSVRDIRRNAQFRLLDRQTEFKYIWQIVSTENMSNRKLAALWDLTSLTNLESEVIAALGLIERRVSGIAFVEDISRGRSGDNRIPLVKIKGIDEPLPLKSMGDGMTRLLHLIVALVNARDGLLLIDEFENGLHWTVQPKVWDVIFQLSERLNVQVFATTHSRDCIESFDRTWNNYPELGAFFRLDAKEEFIKVTEYTSETLTDSIETEVEVR